jgi:hypothetical protein
MKKRILFGVGGCLIILVASYFITDAEEAGRITDGLKMARIAISANEVQLVNQKLIDGAVGWDVMQTEEYRELVQTLKMLTNSFSVKAKWTYIAASTGSEDTAKLVVLTVDPEKNDPLTIAGVSYSVDEYPSMQRAIYGEGDLIVSGIVWDGTYNILTRSGFIKLYDGGRFVGVLGVDLEAGEIFARIGSTFFLFIIYGGIFLLMFFKMVGPQFGLSKRQKELFNEVLVQGGCYERQVRR